MPGDIIILHKCTKNHDHTLYCSWDRARDGCNCYFSFWAILCPLTPLTAQKINFLKKMKKMSGDIIILHKRAKYNDHILYGSWDMAHDEFHFGLFLPFHPPNSPKKSKFKNIKMSGEIMMLHMCTKTYDQMMYSFWDMLHEGWTKVTYRGGCPT